MSFIPCRSLFLATALALLLSGCGLAQRTVASGSALAQDIFYAPVTVLQLDFNARAALNTAPDDMSALSVSTLVRVYQLKERQALDAADYPTLLSADEPVLAADLLDVQTVLVKPGEGAQLNVPLSADAQYVAVVALFRSPDIRANTWRLVLRRDELEADRPRVIALGDNALTLRPLAKEEGWW